MGPLFFVPLDEGEEEEKGAQGEPCPQTTLQFAKVNGRQRLGSATPRAASWRLLPLSVASVCARTTPPTSAVTGDAASLTGPKIALGYRCGQVYLFNPSGALEPES